MTTESSQHASKSHTPKPPACRLTCRNTPASSVNRELVTNSICHSNSARPGGTFTVRVSLDGRSLRVEVEDQGGPWAHDHHNDGQSGRGLLIVSQLATTWDISGDGTSARVVWFTLDCP